MHKYRKRIFMIKGVKDDKEKKNYVKKGNESGNTIGCH